MLTRVVVLIAALLVGCNRGTKKATEPASTTPKQYTVADFYKNVSFDGDSWSPDKRKLLVSSNLSGIWNAYAENAIAFRGDHRTNPPWSLEELDHIVPKTLLKH